MHTVYIHHPRYSSQAVQLICIQYIYIILDTLHRPCSYTYHMHTIYIYISSQLFFTGRSVGEFSVACGDRHTAVVLFMYSVIYVLLYIQYMYCCNLEGHYKKTAVLTGRDYWVRSPKLPAANFSRRVYVPHGIRTTVLL